MCYQQIDEKPDCFSAKTIDANHGNEDGLAPIPYYAHSQRKTAVVVTMASPLTTAQTPIWFNLMRVVGFLAIVGGVLVIWLHSQRDLSLIEKATLLVAAPGKRPNPDVYYFRITNEKILLNWKTKGSHFRGVCYDVSTGIIVGIETLMKDHDKEHEKAYRKAISSFAWLQGREQAYPDYLKLCAMNKNYQFSPAARRFSGFPTIRLASNQELIDCAFCLKHGKAAWLIREEYAPPALTWLHRWLPFVKVKTQQRITLYTGTNRYPMSKVVGSVTNWPGLESYCEPSLQWSPDGKDLNFLYNNTVYNTHAN